MVTRFVKRFDTAKEEPFASSRKSPQMGVMTHLCTQKNCTQAHLRASEDG